MSPVTAATPYQDWHDLFREFAGFETVGSEDVLAALLPLMRQTLGLHEEGQVAPLDGVEQLGVHRGRLFIGPGKGAAPREEPEAVARLQGMHGALDFDGGRRPADAFLDEADPVALSAGGDANRALGLAGPALVPGYRCWEQLIGHHDALTDIFCLGQLGASLAVGVDLTEPRAVERLAKNRRRLGRLNPRLHPTVARQLTRMTELDRRDREQDLAGAIDRLESYRRLGRRRADRGAEAEMTGAKPPPSQTPAIKPTGSKTTETAAADPLGTAPTEQAARSGPRRPSSPKQSSPKQSSPKQSSPKQLRDRAILGELRGRLYDLSRRNRLLFHRPSSAELDLTEASTPIVMRADAIRADQIFTLSSAPARALLRGETVPLGDIVRFEDMAHASAALDKLRAEDRKDRAEVGVSQLRLIIGFLDWRNLKHEPETPVRSPLLLLPVRLKKRRGVRDSFELSADGAEAEVNPTLRRYLRVLYAVDMPDRVDLSDVGAVGALHEALATEIARTEPGVTLELRAEPDIRALHRRALRRVDLYKRKARPAGAARRRYGDIDYSYQRESYRALGLQLYERFVAPAAAPTPQADFFAASAPTERRASSGLPLGDSGPADGAAPLDVAKADGGAPPLGAAPPVPPPAGGDPYAWSVDLCALTLSNLNYRRMSLVRDYDALLAGDADAGAGGDDENAGAAFEEIFADEPRPTGAPPAAPAIAERRSVVESDPTQDAAIARARAGGSFVIQGPPGAGKSQTIANLIADQVAMGRRVLFIAEKRAAIDVVLRRLDAIDLAPLAARVHDSADDKKAFVQEVRGLFEAWSAPGDPSAPPAQSDGVLSDVAYGADAGAQARRTAALAQIDAALARLAALDRDMRASLEGEPTHALLTQAAQADRTAALDPLDRARAPSLREWREGRSAAREMAAALRRLGAEPILARHPARFVSADACADPALFDRLTSALDTLGPHLERIAPAADLAVWDGAAAADSAPDSAGGGASADAAPAPLEAAPLAALFAQIDYAERLRPVAIAGRLKAFDVESALAAALKRRVDDLALERAQLSRAGDKTRIWEDKLSDIEAQTALELARRHEGKLLGFLSKPWRQVRDEVTRRCRLGELTIKPQIRALLEDLVAEHEAAAQVALRLREVGEEMGLEEGDEALRLIEERDNRAPREGDLAAPLLRLCIADPAAAEARIMSLSALKPAADAARAALARCFDGLDALPVERAFAALSELRAERDQLPGFAPALRALAGAPETVRAALRRIDAPVEMIEQSIIDAAAERALSMRPGLREISGAMIDEARAEIVRSLQAFRAANARLALDAARRRFVGHLDLTQRLELELDPDSQRLRRRFVDARRDLERELSKSQRFRSIRELLAGPAGLLLRDLKPVWMMSPLSVADVLPLERGLFDLVIFDEASQVTVEAAAPSLFRAAQAVVVGDEKQMPPSRFFTSAGPSGADEVETQDAAEDLAQELIGDRLEDLFDPTIAGGDALIDPIELGDASRVIAGALAELDADSLLSQACRSLPSVLLGWHYRSRSEELIAFSNAVFYAGKLITIPSIKRRRGAEPIVAGAAEQGADLWREALARSVSFHHTPFGRFVQRRNPDEATYVAEMVRGFLLAKATKSLGVVAFSEAQAAEIERALERLAKKDAKFRRAYEAELEREIDGAFAGLFVKNLENVQGDERDMIIVSVGYAPDAAGKFRQNFGPVNREGGERRLNVLFTRAREHLALVSSIRSSDLGSVANDGALCLKSYLAYAEAVSRGDGPAAARVLSASGRDVAGPDARASALAAPIAEALRARGFVAETALGQSRFTLDVAARRRDDPDWTVAVLIDGPAHYDVADHLERYALRPNALEAFGWRVVTVLSVDWRRDPDSVLDRISAALRA